MRRHGHRQPASRAVSSNARDETASCAACRRSLASRWLSVRRDAAAVRSSARAPTSSLASDRCSSGACVRTSPSRTASSVPTTSSRTRHVSVRSCPSCQRTSSRAGSISASGPIRTSRTSLALRPRIAFITDIRRGNLLAASDVQGAHRAVADRAEFLSRCSRAPARPELGSGCRQQLFARL